jgi:4-aminobutyrate aminotransferase-like enzyme
LAKPTHGTTIRYAKYSSLNFRFAPPLIMTEKQLDECLKIIKGVINGL